MARRSTNALAADARNRALRTFLVNLAADVAVALVLVLVAAFSKAEGWDDFDWALLGFTLAKTAVVTAGSYVLRRFVDGSAVPTPLPPAPQVAPEGDSGHALPDFLAWIAGCAVLIGIGVAFAAAAARL